MTLSRRSFIGGATLSVAATNGFAQDPYDTLIAGQYANDVQFISQIGGQYLGDNFQLSTTPTPWTLRLGRYPGRINGTRVDWHGYWIYKKGVNQCWQAVNHGGGALVFWNQDGRARGNPEDWELFMFEKVDKNARTLKIYNSAYVPYRTIIEGHVPNPSDCRNYVNLVGTQFSCNDNSQHAAIFTVKFL
jgi:hypothetical protein